MKSVFIVSFSYSEEDHGLLGIFSSESNAQSFIDSLDSSKFGRLYLEEVDIDSPFINS